MPGKKAEGRKDYYMVHPDNLIIEKDFNPREEFGDMKGLKDSIRARGIKVALVGKRIGNDFLVRKGHRRTIALKELAAEGIEIYAPVMTQPQYYSAEQETMDLLIDNSELNFTPWERAKVVMRAINYGKTEQDIVKESGLSLVYVKRLLSLANAPQKLINLVRSGVVKGTLAMDMIAEKRVDELLEKAEKNELPKPGADGDLFPGHEVPSGKKEKITRSDLKPNSWKVFQKWVPAVEAKKLSPQKAQFLDWLRKMMNGELTEEDFQKFFD